MKKNLVVCADEDLGALVGLITEQAGFQPTVVYEYEAAMEVCGSEQLDLILVVLTVHQSREDIMAHSPVARQGVPALLVAWDNHDTNKWAREAGFRGVIRITPQNVVAEVMAGIAPYVAADPSADC